MTFMYYYIMKCHIGHSLGGGMANIFVLKYNYNPVHNLPLYGKHYAFASPFVLWHNNPEPPAILNTIINVAAKNDIVPRLGEETHYIY